MPLFLVSFLQMIIEISYTMHKHLHSLTENISDIFGIREKSVIYLKIALLIYSFG